VKTKTDQLAKQYIKVVAPATNTTDEVNLIVFGLN
jgi:hypothetical protein